MYKSANSVRGEVPVFDGITPLSKSENLLINLQFRADETNLHLFHLGFTGTITIYFSEELFEEDEDENYWNSDNES